MLKRMLMAGGSCVALVLLTGLACPAFASATPWTLGPPTAIAQTVVGAAGAYDDVGCWSAGNCIAVGTASFDDNGDTYPIAAQEANGVWQAGQSLSSGWPVNASGYVIAGVTGISCVASGACIAVGKGGIGAGSEDVWDMTESGGVWSGPTDLGIGDDYTLEGVACASASYCVAVGIAFGNTADTGAAAVGTVGGLGGVAAVSSDDLFYGISCLPNTQTCTAVGDDDNEAAVQTDTAGSWSAPDDLTTGTGAGGEGWQGYDIACPQAGACSVVGVEPGSYSGPAYPFTVQQTSGTWGAPTSLGSDGASYGALFVGQLGCISPGNCLLGGDMGRTDGGQALLAQETDGTWGGYAASPEPSDANVSEASESLGVGCAGTRCDVVGYYNNSQSTRLPYAFSVSQPLPASGTAVACSELTDGTTNYSCTATVSDASGATPPGTPTGTVTLSPTLGTFPNGSACTLSAGAAGKASCSLEYDPGAGYGTQVTITGAYAGDSAFSASQGQTTFTPECDQDPTETDGDWEFGGCFTDPDATDYDTQQNSSLDGMTVTPSSSSDQVDYSTGGSGGTSVSSSGATSLALNVSSLSGGSQGLVTLTNQLQKLNLSGGPVTVPLASGFKLLGLPLSGNIKFTPQSGGTAVGSVSGTLPQILGGGLATVTVTTTFKGQVTSIVATATSGTLANVFGLSTLKLSYANSTWTVNATAKGAGGSTQTLSGSLSFNGSGQTTAGNLKISNVVLAGLLNIKTFSVSYSAQKGWAGSASLTQGKQAASVSITISTQGVMTSGSITASGVTLWQVFTLTKFAMTYQQKGNTWGLSLAVEGKKDAPAVTASLAVSDGTVTGADLDFKNVSMLGKITIDDLHLKYTSTGGHDDFSGETKLSLPSTVVSKIEGSFRMVDGSLVMAKLVAKGNVPLYGALTLNKLGGEIDLAPKKVIKGFVGLSAGPKTDKGSLLGLDNGEIDYAFPDSADGSGVYTFSGDLTALGKTLGQGKLVADNGIVKLDLKLGGNGVGFKIGKNFTANGTIAGALHGTKFTIRGNVHFDASILGHKYQEDGVIVVSNNGVTACAAIPALAKDTDSGVFYSWDNELTTYKGGCPY